MRVPGIACSCAWRPQALSILPRHGLCSVCLGTRLHVDGGALVAAAPRKRAEADVHAALVQLDAGAALRSHSKQLKFLPLHTTAWSARRT